MREEWEWKKEEARRNMRARSREREREREREELGDDGGGGREVMWLCKCVGKVMR